MCKCVYVFKCIFCCIDGARVECFRGGFLGRGLKVGFLFEGCGKEIIKNLNKDCITLF